MSSSARLGGWKKEWPTRKPTFLEIPSLESLISLGLMLGCNGHFLAMRGMRRGGQPTVSEDKEGRGRVQQERAIDEENSRNDSGIIGV